MVTMTTPIVHIYMRSGMSREIKARIIKIIVGYSGS